MLFWIIICGLALAVAAVLAAALLRGRAAAVPAAAFDLEVYRAQLSEVDRDLARGVLSDEDAARVRTEVSRRILAADTALQAATGRAGTAKGRSIGPAVLIVAVMVAGSFAMYLRLGAPGYGDLALQDRIAAAAERQDNRPGQQAAEAQLAGATRPAPQASAEYLALVGQLRETVAQRPDDATGHELLAQAEARLGNFDAAHRAQARVVALRGEDAGEADLADLADMMILAAGGYVSPEAQAVLERLLTIAPGNPTGRYYYGLMLAQIGRPDQAFRIWDQLLRAGPDDAPWIAPIVAQIDDLAMLAGVRGYQRPAPTPERGPSAADIEAAGEMSATDRMAMIEGMVSGLSDRLATEGGPPEDWAQLVTALGVLGRTDEARDILREARQVFGDTPGALDILRAAAERAGIE